MGGLQCYSKKNCKLLNYVFGGPKNNTDYLKLLGGMSRGTTTLCSCYEGPGRLGDSQGMHPMAQTTNTSHNTQTFRLMD